MPSLIVRHDRKPAREVALEKELVLIGRAAAADIAIDAADGPEEYATIMRLGEDFVFSDLSPDAGTLINGQHVKKRVLKDRDLITIGEYRMTFQDKREADKPVGIEEEAAGIGAQRRAPPSPAGSVDPFRSAPGGKSKLVTYLVLAAIVAGIFFASYQSYTERRAADEQAALVKRAYDEKLKSEAEKLQEHAQAIASSIKKQ